MLWSGTKLSFSQELGWLGLMLGQMLRVSVIAICGVGKEFSFRSDWQGARGCLAFLCSAGGKSFAGTNWVSLP